MLTCSKAGLEHAGHINTAVEIIPAADRVVIAECGACDMSGSDGQRWRFPGRHLWIKKRANDTDK